MKPTATLLLINITKLYPMAKSYDEEITNAFIAIYHDKIIAMGTGDYQKYIDKDTRIINGNHCIAIPGIIDVRFEIKPPLTPYLYEHHLDQDTYYALHPAALLRDMQALLYSMLQKGITTFAYPPLPKLYEDALKQLLHHPYECMPGVLTRTDIESCEYDAIQYPCFDPFYHMRKRKESTNLSELELLKRFTSNAALALKQPQLGSIAPHQQADILLIEGTSLAYVLHQITAPIMRSIIKKGTQQFPNIII